MCKTLYNCSFTNTGFTDKCRVILVTSGKNLNNAFDLLVASDDGVERTGAGSGGKINAHLVNGGGFGVFCVTFMWCARLA